MKPLNVGDRVTYSVPFLRAVGGHIGDLPHAKGIVTQIDQYGAFTLATVDWGMGESPERVNVKNLAKMEPH
jgi:hypothetical protein